MSTEAIITYEIKTKAKNAALKEIYEQPQVIGDTLHSFLNPADQTLTLPDLPLTRVTVLRRRS